MGLLETVSLNVFCALMGALIGAYAGFSFANARDRRILTIQMLREMLCEEFTKKRISFQDALSEPNPNLASFAASDTDAMRQLRLNLVEVFNFYDLICDLYVSKDIDKKLFEKYMRSIIADDYKMVDEVLRKIEIQQLHTEGDLRRPFFPSIGEVVGR